MGLIDAPFHFSGHVNCCYDGLSTCSLWDEKGEEYIGDMDENILKIADVRVDDNFTYYIFYNESGMLDTYIEKIPRRKLTKEEINEIWIMSEKLGDIF